MRVALFSKSFLPRVGGIETSSAMIANTWRDAGHEVEVITAVPDSSPSKPPYPVTRSWSPRSLLEACRRAEVVVTNGYSRAVVVAAALARKRLVIFHQGYQLICSDGLGFRDRRFHDFDWAEDVKLAFAAGPRPALQSLARIPFDAAIKRARAGIVHVVPSHHVARRLGLPEAEVIYQPPNPAVMAGLVDLGPPVAATREENYRAGDIAFFGRLVFEKGCDNLIEAYGQWRRSHPVLRARQPPRLVLHGEGPERERLVQLIDKLGLAGEVEIRPFLGGRDLAAAARKATVVVIPSRWEEPGATIAVELFASGAAVIASETGAQGEIFAGNGRLFPNREVEGLARALAAHFESGPVYPRPRGDEPWLLPAIQGNLLRLMENEQSRAHE